MRSSHARSTAAGRWWTCARDRVRCASNSTLPAFHLSATEITTTVPAGVTTGSIGIVNALGELPWVKRRRPASGIDIPGA